MKKWFVILLFGCTATKPASRPAISIEVWDNATLTAHVQALEKNVVYLDRSQVQIDSATGAATMSKTMFIDTIKSDRLVVSPLTIITTDTLPGHGGLDSVPIIPIDSTSGRFQLLGVYHSLIPKFKKIKSQ